MKNTQKIKKRQQKARKRRFYELTGVVRGSGRGFAFVQPSMEEADEIFIPREGVHGALHGDLVRIRIVKKADPAQRKKAEGEVLRILKQSKDTIIGLYLEDEAGGYVHPDSKNYGEDFYIARSCALSAKDGDKVIIERLPRKQHRGPRGRVIQVLGNAEAPGVAVTSIACAYDFQPTFPEPVIREADQLPNRITENELDTRRDLRDLFTVTIDGADSKDFDDAISIEKEGNQYRVYVHIADVSHYVKEGSAMDQEALSRGNSVYLLDRVIPMLPEKLSNDLCSLNPNADRLAMTTEMLLDERAEVISYSFSSSVIHSNYRLIYDDVSDYMEKGQEFSRDAELYLHLDLFQEVYDKLRILSEKRGALDFDFPERKISLDADGNVLSVGRAERRTANRVIEELMILTNRIVGAHFHEMGIPFIYRIHEAPEKEAVDRLNHALSAFGYDPVSEEADPKVFRDILERAEGTPQEGILNSLVLRSLQKAVYSSHPEEHFGIAAEHYTHFTSPIRRYSDLIAHRLVKNALQGKKREDERWLSELNEHCRHISDTEEQAEEAERDVEDLKCAEYMRKYIGEVQDGIVSSLTHFGIFVMLENTVEGLIPFREMTDDYYSYDEDRFRVIGERYHREIRYGDRVKIQVAASNPILRQIDFRLLEVNGVKYEAGESISRK